VWLAVASVIALGTFEAMSSLRASLAAAVAVNGGGERLESLAVAPRSRSAAWTNSSLVLREVTLVQDGRELLGRGDLRVEPHTRVALVGESGVGKSSLLRAIVDLDEPASGDITLGGVAIEDLDETELRRRVAYVASEPGLTRGYARDVVALGRTGTRDAMSDLASLGITAEGSTKFEDLSRGERARVAIARCLVSAPEVVVLDEPTAGLGRTETARVLSLLATSGASIIVATHDADVVAWCDVVVELREGRLVSR
jgi:ABC-type transport system involved in cytochrome bd biosynthesis fused ATPase/permease subunit